MFLVSSQYWKHQESQVFSSELAHLMEIEFRLRWKTHKNKIHKFLRHFFMYSNGSEVQREGTAIRFEFLSELSAFLHISSMWETNNKMDLTTVIRFTNFLTKNLNQSSESEKSWKKFWIWKKLKIGEHCCVHNYWSKRCVFDNV